VSCTVFFDCIIYIHDDRGTRMRTSYQHSKVKSCGNAMAMLSCGKDDVQMVVSGGGGHSFFFLLALSAAHYRFAYGVACILLSTESR
jgi:hypothetical protein